MFAAQVGPLRFFVGLAHYTRRIFGCHYMDGPTQGYSNSELQNLRKDADPDRGTFCEKCGLIVPAFTDLTDEDVRSLRQTIANGSALIAMLTLHKQTRCPIRWAKLWVYHPHPPPPPTPPCPSCGSQLRTPTARQCPKCFHSWHEVE